jgi:SAM-dependent methyltransferase
MTWEKAVQSLIDDPSMKDHVSACYYDVPLAGAAARYAASPEWQEVRRFAGPARGVAVDVGAGNGISSYAMALDGWTTIAVEPDSSELVGAAAIRRLGRETGVAIDVREGVGEGLPLRDGEASFVFARQVLHHARDLPAFCIEIGRVLAPGGVFISARDHVITGPEQLQPFFDGHALHRYYGGENAFQLAEYRAAFRGAGLVIEQELKSVSTVINYAPHSPETMRDEIAKRCGPLRPLAKAALSLRPVLNLALTTASVIDRRPGRLVSFVCRRPM